MVSTRGVRYKFSEGERVLCYEPDPTKAKVLYDSKVLEVIESKDKRGRRTVEYLIHFQGWNSSWDRCVSEDFVLKDTEENRQLQRDLAEKSQLQLGAYLYRRERKKGGSAGGPGPAKRARHGFSDDGSSSSTPPEGMFAEASAGDTDSSSGSGSSRRRSPAAGRAHPALPSALRDRLTFDYHLVVKRGRVSKLPASPSAAQILESFVKWFARAGAWRMPRSRTEPPVKPDLRDVCTRLNLVREVADGLRVYFDFILRGHLLYRQEATQYQDYCGRFNEDLIENIKKEPSDEDEPDFQEDEINNKEEMSIEDDLKSPKIPEYSHLPPDPDEPSKNQENSNHIETRSNESPDKLAESNEKETQYEMNVDDNQNHSGASRTRECRNSSSEYVSRRLRSHKSAVSQSENEEPAPSTSTGEPKAFETMSSSLGSSGSSMSESWSQSAAPPAPAPAQAPATNRTPLSLLLDKVAKWQIIPREGTEHLPSRVYGAIHLARLFVKLPDFLNATQMPDLKLKLILKHIDMFVQYLEEHSEWFGEMYYIADSQSRTR